MAKQFIGTEATGVYVGTLVEDMITTVAREKKLYCNVHIPEFFAKDTDYPLTYVPLWAMSLPLKEGDKVLVEFHQDNLMYPVLYKNPNEIDKGFYEQFNVNKTTDLPNNQDTEGAFRLGNDSYIIKTKNYTIIHQNNGFLLLDDSGKVYVYGSAIKMISSGKTLIKANDNTIGNDILVPICEMVSNLIEYIRSITTLTEAVPLEPLVALTGEWLGTHAEDILKYNLVDNKINASFD